MAQLTDVAYDTKIVAISCGNCHIPFGIPQGLYDAAREDGRLFYCPNGDHVGYGDTELDRLRRERTQLLDAKERLVRQRDTALADAEHQRRVAIGTKGALVKTQKRISKGVCPCCQRHFTNVHLHMATQHPDFGGEAD